MNAPTRVLVVDDSATARDLLVSLCRDDPALEVVGEARDGQEAVDLVERLRPDIVVMDIHMPVLDGLAATRKIMQSRPTPVLAVTATLRPDDIALAMRSIEAGAVGVMEKPSGADDAELARATTVFRRKVRTLAQVHVIRRYDARPRRPRQRAQGGRWAGKVVGVAASTGGPVALRNLLRGLPADFPAPIAAVQHIAAGFLPGYAQWLGADLPLRVKIAEDREPFVPGTVYLAPDDHHLLAGEGWQLRLDASAPINGFRPSASALFASLAAAHGRGAVGVILTGLGSDGRAGMQTLHDGGGCVLAQDPDTAVAPSMPAAVIRAGLAHAVAPVEGLATQILELCTPKKEASP